MTRNQQLVMAVSVLHGNFSVYQHKITGGKHNADMAVAFITWLLWESLEQPLSF